MVTPCTCCRQDLPLLQLLCNEEGQCRERGNHRKRMARGGRPLTATGVAVYVHRLRARLKYGGVVIRTLRGFGLSVGGGEQQAAKIKRTRVARPG